MLRTINYLARKNSSNASSLYLLLRSASTSTEGKNSIDKFQELKKMNERPLYMDVQATTAIDPRVLDAMMPYMTSMYGNPHSRTHAFGWESEKAVEEAREQVAAVINADPKEIIFTSGA